MIADHRMGFRARARSAHEIQNSFSHLLAHGHGAHQFLRGDEVVWTHDSFGSRFTGAGGQFEHGAFGIAVRKADFDLQQETIKLRFRQRIGAFLFDRILGSQNMKGTWQSGPQLAQTLFGALLADAPTVEPGTDPLDPTGDHVLNPDFASFKPEGGLKPAAVLIAVDTAQPEPDVTLTVRTSNLSAHAGQIAFPGGRMDAGEVPAETALREAHEEVALQADRVALRGYLPTYRSRTGYRVFPVVARVFAALERDGDEVRLVGGCVRNLVLGEPAGDLDLATQAEPETVMRRAEEAGLKAIPTGIEHGTVTVVADHIPFEVTTLRRDVETDGRRAVVAFSRDFAEDAARRDFTMNALYVDSNGVLHDPLGGLDDLEARRVRFIGDAGERIREDYLRVLRYFRFYGWYGRGAPDRDAVKAIVTNKSGLSDLSAERVWSELKKLLAAPQAARSLLWMRQTGVYQIVLPESGDMDLYARFGRLEDALELDADPMLRLLALLPLNRAGGNRVKALVKRLKLSGAEAERLHAAQSAVVAVGEEGLENLLKDEKALRQMLYRYGVQAMQDALVQCAAMHLDADPELDLPDPIVSGLRAALALADLWEKPALPVSGKDMLAHGIEPGPQVGAALQVMEGAWVASDFSLDRDALLDVLKN
eukprot:g17543.t1